MICTFGDITDVTWWRELSLPVRAVIMPNGAFRFDRVGFTRLGDARRGRGPGRLRPAGQPLGDEGAREGGRQPAAVRRSDRRPAPITHPVKFYEKGDRPLEIITSRQWFFKTTEFRDALLARGASQWHPEYMRHRYENWVNGLAGDWCVSRQRFFGVPFPVCI